MATLKQSNNSNDYMWSNFVSSNEGISMISLIVAIIVMLIIAGVSFIYSNNSVGNAGRADFFQEVFSIKEKVAEKKFMNEVYGTGEDISNKGFYKTVVKNAPAKFNSFSDDEMYGYVVNLELIGYTEKIKRGKDYKRFEVNSDANEENDICVTFGEDDVYIYDKNGNVFYAKGYFVEEKVYYTNDGDDKTSVRIVSIEKELTEDGKHAKVIIKLKKGKNEITEVKVDENVVARKESNGDEEIYEYLASENKTYLIVVSEKGNGKISESFKISELSRETYTITYNSNGGIGGPGNQTKTEGVPIKIVDERPTRSESVFLGWSENSIDKTAMYLPGSTFTADRNTTLYAIWTINNDRTFNIIYNANGGTNAPSSEYNQKGQYIISNTLPKRDGYGFAGWNTDVMAQTGLYNQGEEITLTQNLYLYAIWTRNTRNVTVSVYPTGAGNVTGNGSKLPGGDVYASTTPNPGYVFKNWTVKSGGALLKNSSSATVNFIMPDRDVELVANYEEEKLRIRYDENNGALGATIMKEETCGSGENIVITGEKPVRENYKFLGWSLNKSDTTARYFEGNTYKVTTNVAFYAVWEELPIKYRVTYDLNGGTGNYNGDIGKFTPQEKLKGTSITIPVGEIEEPCRLGYKFKGWTLEKTSSAIVLNPGDKYSKDADITLYAVWEKDTKAPTGSLEVKRDGNTNNFKIVGKANDEGRISGYAWTKSSIPPENWEKINVGGKNILTEKEITEKGTHYFWVKDYADNKTSVNVQVYEISFDSRGGNKTPETIYQPQNMNVTLPNEILTKAENLFLGWTKSSNPGGSSSDVEYTRGQSIRATGDMKLNAVWGDTRFNLSSVNTATRIGGSNIIVSIQKGPFTGEIQATSPNVAIARVSTNNNQITITPGTQIGIIEISVVENVGGSEKKILVRVDKGIRELLINESSTNFIYGDSERQIEFTYTGSNVQVTATSNAQSVASARVDSNNIIIKPEGYGNAIIQVTVPEDDQYLAKTGEIGVLVLKKEIVINPTKTISREYDGTYSTPTLTYTYTGQKTGEIPSFSGTLSRVNGKDVGTYEIGLGTLSLVDNGTFKAVNYVLMLSSETANFEITKKQVLVEWSGLMQVYNGGELKPTATAETGISGEEIQLLIQTTPLSTVDVGTYPVEATIQNVNNGSIGNYVLTNSIATFEITA